MLAREVLHEEMLIDYRGEGRDRLELPVMRFMF